MVVEVNSEVSPYPTCSEAVTDDRADVVACVADLQEQYDLHPRYHTSHENCIPTSSRLEQGAQLAAGRLCTAYMLVSIILGLTIGVIILLVWTYWREMRVLVSATVDLVQLVANIVRDLGQREVEHDNPPTCLLYTSPSPRDATLSRMPSSA